VGGRVLDQVVTMLGGERPAGPVVEIDFDEIVRVLIEWRSTPIL